jgi:hypothetical protein
VKWAADGMVVYLAYSEGYGQRSMYLRGVVECAAGNTARVLFDGERHARWIALDYLYTEEHVARDAAKRLGAG